MVTGQEADWYWGAVFIGLAFGLAVGAGVAAWFLGKSGRAGKLQREVERLQGELDGYREQVTGHFRKTSELIDKMTESYRDVYEHLAESSQQLCETPFQSPRLEMKKPETLVSPSDGKPAQVESEDIPAKPASRFSDDGLQMDEIYGDAPFVPDRSPGESPTMGKER